MSCSSINSTPDESDNSCATQTKPRLPDRPCFNLIDWIVELRLIVSPASKGRMKFSLLPAHMRRGRSMGGKKSPRCGCPSSASSDCFEVSRKYSQCQSGGSASPIEKAVLSRSRVAARPSIGAIVRMLEADCALPTHSENCCGESFCIVGVSIRIWSWPPVTIRAPQRVLT